MGRKKLTVVSGGRAGPPRDHKQRPLPETPRKGFKISVGEELDGHLWTNWSIHAANSRSFVAYSDGVSTRHPNAAWRSWLAARAREGVIKVGCWGEERETGPTLTLAPDPESGS